MFLNSLKLNLYTLVNVVVNGYKCLLLLNQVQINVVELMVFTSGLLYFVSHVTCSIM